MKSISRIFLLTTLAAIAASAGTISITFENPHQTGKPGQTLSFWGEITHVGDSQDPEIYLNSNTLDFTLPDAIVIDNFFANVPIFLAPGDSSGVINLFDIVLTTPLGAYPGTYQLIGGADGGLNIASDNLAQADFSVAVTPEPGTVALLCAGLPFVLWRSLARRRKQSVLTHGHSGD